MARIGDELWCIRDVAVTVILSGAKNLNQNNVNLIIGRAGGCRICHSEPSAKNLLLC